MENTPSVCADDLHTILRIVKNGPKSRSVNIFSSGWILPQTVQKILFTSQSSAQVASMFPCYETVCPKARFFCVVVGCGRGQQSALIPGWSISQDVGK